MPSLATLPKSGLAASTRALLNAARNRTMLAGHSVAPASVAAMARQASTQGKPSVVAVRDALNEGLAEEMAADKNVFVMGEEVGQFQGAYKVTRGLLDRFGPNRVVDTPISEMGFTGLCSGAAMAGLKPVCEFMTWNFAMQSIDHILNSSAKTYYMSGGQKHSNIVFRGPNGAAAGVAAQHSQDYTSWYSQCPGLIVMAPYSAEDAKGMIKAAIREPNPVVLLENELGYADTFEVSEEYHSDNFVTPIGKAKIERPGKDVSIVSHSRNLKFCLEAAETLAKEGIDAEVINLRTLRPLDLPSVVESVKKTGRIVTVEAGFPSYGLGSEIAGLLGETEAWDYLDAPVMRCTGADVPTPYSEELEALCFPDGPTIVKAVKEVCYV